MFACHCGYCIEAAPAEQVVGITEGRPERGAGSRQTEETVLKVRTACAKALMFESLNNEENVSCALHAEPKPAYSRAFMDCIVGCH